MSEVTTRDKDSKAKGQRKYAKTGAENQKVAENVWYGKRHT